jgi:hypothetical protein
VDETAFLDSMLTVCSSRGAARSMLDTPVESLPLDSLDLEILRTTLEKQRGAAIGNDLWQTAPTLRNLMTQL